MCIGDEVAGSWSTGTGTGTVVEPYTYSATKTIKGSEITPDAAREEPAYLIEQDDRDMVLQ